LFGASKVAGDVLAQEYGRYFGLKTCIFRGGCLTGSNHSAVELHGFLNYLFRAVAQGRPYTIYGYKGKQVRDQIGASDVVRAMHAFYKNPRPAEVYNLGGGRGNSTSVLEAIDIAQDLLGKRLDVRYCEEARRGDHICYISNLNKFQQHYPEWAIDCSLHALCESIARSVEGAGV
jgi:CDP-paratose 2-epimerase